MTIVTNEIHRILKFIEKCDSAHDNCDCMLDAHECYDVINYIKELKGKVEAYEHLRVCDHCSKPVLQGYCIEDGWKYYCSDNCLIKHYTEYQYSEMYDEGRAYWSSWVDELPDDLMYDPYGPIARMMKNYEKLKNGDVDDNS